jgi:[acyl-carrier-protein] S-malonyltransferase
MSTAFVFPGQGSQAVGMGKALAEAFAPARAVFAEVDEALGEKLSTLMFEGPEADLTLTANAQPALMAVSLAVTRVLEAEAGLDLAKAAQFVAGHSLGEYSALAAAGAFDLADTARLLKSARFRRCRRPCRSASARWRRCSALIIDTGAGVAKRPPKRPRARSAPSPTTMRRPGRRLGPQRRGRARDGDRQDRGAKRGMLLPVSAPFHCALMQPAADAWPRRWPSVAMAPRSFRSSPMSRRARSPTRMTSASCWSSR